MLNSAHKGQINPEMPIKEDHLKEIMTENQEEEAEADRMINIGLALDHTLMIGDIGTIRNREITERDLTQETMIEGEVAVVIFRL